MSGDPEPHEPWHTAPLPPLRVHHLFVLTTVFAVTMSVWLGIWNLFPDLPGQTVPEFTTGISLNFIIRTLSQSVCFAIVLFGLAWRRQEIPFPCRPGHWMAIYVAISWAYEMALLLSLPIAYQDSWFFR